MLITKRLQTHFEYNISNLKVKEWEEIYLANINQRKSGMAMLVSDKVDFTTKKMTREKEILCNNVYKMRRI